MKKTVMIITGLKMASVENETVKLQNVFTEKGHRCDIYKCDLDRPERSKIPRYDIAVWWTPFLPQFLSRQKPWLNYLKEQVAISYFVIEGTVTGISPFRKWLEWQYVVTPSRFAKTCLEEMRVKVREVIPHQVDPNPPIDHVYGRAWRERFPSSKQVLLYNGSPICRKALPKLRRAIDIVSEKRSDFTMVFHTDNVKAPFHTPIHELNGINTVIEGDFPHLSLSQALAKMKYADIIVHPARTEGFGLPVLEALNLGKTLVCVNAPGVNEIASPENSFMVTKTRDARLEWPNFVSFKTVDYEPGDLAEQIILALDASPEIREAKRQAGLATAAKFFHTYDRFTEF